MVTFSEANKEVHESYDFLNVTGLIKATLKLPKF